jgi:hypothetical protein
MTHFETLLRDDKKSEVLPRWARHHSSDQIWDQVQKQIWDQVSAQIRDQVYDQVWGQIQSQVWRQVREELYDTL